MFSLPTKLSVFEVVFSISILSSMSIIVTKINQITSLDVVITYIILLIGSIFLIVHGLSKWIREEKTTTQINEQTLKFMTAKPHLKIDWIHAEWDLDVDYDDRYNPEQVNATAYKIHVSIYNKGTIPNIVRDFEITSKNHGKIVVNSPPYMKIKDRDNTPFTISATLWDKHADKGDIITLKMKDFEDTPIEASKEVNNYSYSEDYKKEFPID